MNEQFTAGLRRHLIETYEPLIDKSRPVALIDFPSAINIGDHAIWLGEKMLLRKLGITPAYECSLESYDRDAMAAAVKDGTILMQGGGNFGDMYVYHTFRLKVLADFPNNPVIVFPQSMMFYSTQKLHETAADFEAHGNVIVTARDALTHYKMSKYFGPKTKVVLAPDIAFMLGTINRTRKPKFDIVWLHRDDREAAQTLPREQIAQFGAVQKTRLQIAPITGGGTLASSALFAGDTLCVTDWYSAELVEAEAITRYNTLDFDSKSRFWLAWAATILSLGRVVITERLHGHILCVMAGIPHILLNNNYGKNFAYYDTWSKDLRGCWISPNPRQALEFAQTVVKAIPKTDAA